MPVHAFLAQAAVEYVGVTGSGAIATLEAFSRRAVAFATEHLLLLVGAAVLLVFLFGRTRRHG